MHCSRLGVGSCGRFQSKSRYKCYSQKVSCLFMPSIRRVNPLFTLWTKSDTQVTVKISGVIQGVI